MLKQSKTAVSQDSQNRLQSHDESGYRCRHSVEKSFVWGGVVHKEGLLKTSCYVTCHQGLWIHQQLVMPSRDCVCGTKELGTASSTKDVSRSCKSKTTALKLWGLCHAKDLC